MKVKLIVGVAMAALACAGQAQKASVAADSKDVVVTVGDAKLTRAQLDADVAKFIEARKAQIPAAQLEQAKSYLAMQFRQQFVTKTLLLNEAKKKGLVVTDDEVATRANEIIKANQGRPGAPATLDDLLAKHPLGIERARVEFKDSVLINKFVDQEIASKIKVDPAEVKKQYDAVVSNIAPRAVHDMCDKFLNGDVAGAAKLQRDTLDLCENLFSEVNPIPVKKAVNMMGFNAGPLRMPLTEMEEEHAQKLAAAMRAFGLIK